MSFSPIDNIKMIYFFDQQKKNFKKNDDVTGMDNRLPNGLADLKKERKKMLVQYLSITNKSAYMHISFTSPLAKIRVQSQVVILKLKKLYLMPPCLTLGIIRYGSRGNE